MTSRIFLLLPLGVLLLVDSASGRPEKVKVAPDRNWVSIQSDGALRKLAPKNGLITDGETFEKLWRAWRKGENAPAVDFLKGFVVVTLAGGPNRPFISATLENGAMTVRAIQTQMAGEGFGYSLALFNRTDVKSVNGKELPAKRPPGPEGPPATEKPR